MRRSSPHVSRSAIGVRLVLGVAVAAALALTTLQAQIPGRNVNMVSGVTLPDGDPYLQRQNEPSMAASTRNPLHLLGGSNDYRTVDVPGLPNSEETGDAWLGLYKSADGGQRWTSTLLPGYPQEPAGEGLDAQGRKSPLFTGGYKAAADPVVRAGTNGLFYYAGLSFDRGENGKSAIFLARFIDNNNREERDATAYLGTGLVATASGIDERFLDKPWMAVDIPRGGNPGTCRIETPGELNVTPTGIVTQEPPVVQIVPAGTVYVAYTSFFGPSEDRRSEILLTRSFDCGVSWQAPMRVSRSEDPINQGVSIAIDPRNGHVYVAWRRFSRPSTPGTTTPDLDGIMFAKLPAGGRKFNPPGVARRFPKGQKKGLQPERFSASRTGKEIEQLNEFDQATGEFKFRTNAYPAMAVDGGGRAYLAWSERGFATFRSSSVDGDARIVMATTTDGNTFTAPRAIDNSTAPDDPTVTELVGHQVMPSVAFAGGKIMVAYYDLRETKAKSFGPQITDANLQIRNTIDIRAAMAEPGEAPEFAPSVKVSEYMTGFRNATSPREQLQFNPPNLPMFKQGTVPFMGDYIDLAPAPAFVPTGKGRWAFNTAATAALPTFHAVWTDNRDVRAPTDGDWTKYGPPTSAVSVQACVPGTAGSRNQNIYTSRIAGGLFVGSPGNAKPLSATVQRGFVVFAQNATTQTRTFRMTILNQPPGGRASFDQFPRSVAPALRTSIDLRVLPRSTASRTVYITSTDPRAQVTVDTSEIAAVGGAEVAGGLEGVVVLNPDIENPDIENPDIENPDIENVEVYNPDIENPDIENPDIENPDIENPDIENPDIENPDIENPDIENIVIANPDIENPDIENPDIENPDIENPDIENPDIENVAVGGDGVLTDITWNVTNTGNTTAAFNVNLFLANTTMPAGLKTQLILHKTYRTPAVNPTNCLLAYESRTIVIANIPRPDFVRPTDTGVPDQNDPSEKNATLWLGPGEIGKVTLRVYDALRSDNDIIYQADGTPVSVDPAFNPQTTVTPTISSQGVGTLDKNAGKTDPPLVTPTGANLFFLQMPTDSIEGAVIAPTVAVQVRDNLTGTPVAGATVTLQLGTNPSEANLAGNVSLPTGVDGIATFPALAVSAVGSGYTLVANATTGDVLAQAVSTAFNVASAIPPSVVVNTNDSGPGSLRAAMLYANATPGLQTITFAIPPGPMGPPFVITPDTTLPGISQAATIDGLSQPGSALGAPNVVVSGADLPIGSNGFVVTSDGTVIRGLVINNFAPSAFQEGSAVLLTGNSNVVEASFLGTAVNGASPASIRTYNGVKVTGSNNRIGGADRSTRNVIAGNFQGVWLVSGNANVVAFNNIGTNFAGTAVVPTLPGPPPFANDSGVLVDGGTGAVIGLGPGLSNVISGNGVGVLVRGGSGTAIAANNIGLDAAGVNAIPNNDGVSLYNNPTNTMIGGAAVSSMNLISGNTAWGINLDGVAVTNTSVFNNKIGLGVGPDNLAVPNQGGGIRNNGASSTVIGQPTRGNIISGNDGPSAYGILIAGNTDGATIQSNKIGTDPTGSSARPNGPTGGDNAALFVINGSRNILIGGSLDDGEGNLISGNSAVGVKLWGHNNLVRGNLIGTTASGLVALPNGKFGVQIEIGIENTIGGAGGFGNVISGNTQGGVIVSGQGDYAGAFGTSVVGNAIGVGADLTTVVPNGGAGVDLREGTSTEVTDNLIRGNTEDGVAAWQGTTGNLIGANTIYDNGGLGIDLENNGVDGIDIGDADTGGNNRQNYPVLSNAINNGGAASVNYDTTSFAPGSYVLRFYANAACDPSGFGEGEQFVGTVTVDAGVTGTAALSPLATAGQRITATATAGANTSEFSACAVVAGTAVVGPAGGGDGGLAFGPVDCPAGSVVVGFLGRAGQSIDRTSIACASLPGLVPTGTFFVAGGDGGSDYGATLTCAAGEAVTGVFGKVSGFGWIDTLGITCTNLSTSDTTNLGPVATDDGGTPFTLACDAGTRVVGLQGRQGALLDQIAIRCQ